MRENRREVVEGLNASKGIGKNRKKKYQAWEKRDAVKTARGGLRRSGKDI